MYYTSDLQYMRKELKFSLSLIDYIQKKYGDELSETQKSRIMYLLQTLKELKLDVKYLNQNPEILNCIDVYTDEEFLSLIEYIKKIAKKKSPNTILALFIASEQIIKNNRQNEVEQIIRLLEKEGLADILDNRSVNYIILKEASYLTISKNINSLSKVKTYKTIIRKNPEILFKGTTYDIQKIVEQIRLIDENEKQDNTQNDTLFSDIVLDEQNSYMEDNEQYEDDAIGYEDTDEGKVLLGNEDNVIKVIEAFKKFNMPYNIIFINPEICRRKKIYEVENILKILYDNNIPFNILDYSNEILEIGKSKNILEIIRFLKAQNINLDILCVCPDILIKSNIKKIENVLNMLDKENINRSIIYSCPQVLISGNVKIYIDIKNEFETSYPDIDVVLDMAPYVFVEKISNMANILDNSNSDTVNRSYLSNSNKITIVKNIDEAQKVIDVLKEENIDLNTIKKEPKLLTRTTAKQTKDILNSIDAVELNKTVVSKVPELLIYSSAIAIKETTSKLKEYRPLKYKDIIEEVPEVYIKTDNYKIERIMDTFEKERINYTFIDKNPSILLRENEEEIGKVSKKLKSIGFSNDEIEKEPKILIEGREKYIDRNINILKKNKLDLPLCSAFTMKTRKLEKNIDLFIENDLHQYIEKQPEVLDIDSNNLAINIALAKLYNISLVCEQNKDNKKQKVIDSTYLNSSQAELVNQYGMNEDIIKKVQAKIERKRDRKIKNVELYTKIYPIIEVQADICLGKYQKDEVSYTKNNKIVSKQKLIRETYLDLEEAYDKKGKLAIKEFKPEEKLDKKLDNLTKKKKGEFNKTVEIKIEDSFEENNEVNL